MVLINQDRVDNVYDEVREMCTPSDAEVLIFCAMDCDAICAVHILAEVLTTDHIRYGLHPVASFLDLQRKFTQLVGEQDGPTAAFLVNCGANTNLHEYLELEKYPGLLLCVVDSHRPLDLANIQDMEDESEYKLYIIDSGDPDDLQPPDLSVLAEISSSEEDDSDDSDSDSDLDSTEDEDEDEGDKEASERRRQRRRTSEEGESAEEELSDLEAEETRRRKRKRSRKRRHKQLEDEIANYYSVTHYGATAASYMFQLAAQLDQKNNKLLWWNIVALTDYYVQERYTGDKYQEKVEDLQNEVGRLNIDPESMLDDAGNSIDRTGLPEVDRIAFSEEYRFMLPRQWTLYDSMMHSSYVSSRLGIWKESGQFKLNMLLAKMGIPLNVCKQQFAHMGQEYKQLLALKLPEFAEEFGLTEITYGSFTKLDGYRVRLSAADVVYSINALLEEDDQTLDEKGREEAIQKGIAITDTNFWNAYLALSDKPTSYATLKRGYKVAIRMQEVVFQQGKIVIDKNQVNDCGRNFRWITMAESVDSQIFSKPMGLGKLALFLSAALRKTKKRQTKVKPLVVATFVPARDMYLVVGVTGAPRVGEASMLHNRFGQLFRKAANETEAQVKHDGFDLSCIEIRKEDLRKVYDYVSINDS